MNSIATVGERNKYGANREPHRVRLGGVNNDPPSAGDIVFGALIGRYHCNTPPLHLIGTRWSSTACPTKPKFYIAIRSGLSRKRGALHQNHVGEVGSTSTITKLTCSPPGFRDQAPRSQYYGDRLQLFALIPCRSRKGLAHRGHRLGLS